MARFKIEATWDELKGTPIVDLEFDRLKHPGTDTQEWQVLGTHRLDDLSLMTFIQVRATALAWLTENAGMVEADSFEFYTWLRASREAIERIAAGSASR